MKNILSFKFLLAILISCSLISCGKKTSSTNTTPTSTQAKYYFNFYLDGVAKTYRSNTLQTGHGFDYSQLGGYILNGESIGSDALGLTIYNLNDSISNTEALAMVGKTFYFDDPNYYVNLNLQILENSVYENYETIDVSNHSFKVTITSVTLIGSGTGINKYNIYEVKGTCSGKVENTDGTKTKTITNGDFYARFTKGIM